MGLEGRKREQLARAGDTSAEIGQAGVILFYFILLLVFPLSPSLFPGRKQYDGPGSKSGGGDRPHRRICAPSCPKRRRGGGELWLAGDLQHGLHLNGS